MPCYRCGTRQVDPARGHSPWRRGVKGDEQVLVCPGCQAAGDWTADLDKCRQCGSVQSQSQEKERAHDHAGQHNQ